MHRKPDRDLAPCDTPAHSHFLQKCTTRRLSDASFTKVHSIFGDERITELLMLVSCYYGLALVLNAADLEADSP